MYALPPNYLECKSDIENTWKVINDVIDNTKSKQKDLLEKLVR